MRDLEREIISKVGEWFQERGFHLATPFGVAVDSLPEKSKAIGLLVGDSQPRKRLFGLVEEWSKREFLGILWIYNVLHGAYGGVWIFEYCGKENENLAKKLSEEVASAFKKNIFLRLAQDERRFEKFLL